MKSPFLKNPKKLLFSSDTELNTFVWDVQKIMKKSTLRMCSLPSFNNRNLERKKDRVNEQKTESEMDSLDEGLNPNEYLNIVDHFEKLKEKVENTKNKQKLEQMLLLSSLYGKKLCMKLKRCMNEEKNSDKNNNIIIENNRLYEEIPDINKACIILKLKNEELQKMRSSMSESINTLEYQEEKKDEIIEKLEYEIEDLKKKNFIFNNKIEKAKKKTYKEN